MIERMIDVDALLAERPSAFELEPRSRLEGRPSRYSPPPKAPPLTLRELVLGRPDPPGTVSDPAPF